MLVVKSNMQRKLEKEELTLVLRMKGQRVPSDHSLWCLGTAAVLGVSVGLDHSCCLNT